MGVPIATQRLVNVLFEEAGVTAASVQGDAHDLALRDGYVAELIAGANAVGTLDVKIQDSADGVTWHDWITFAAVTLTANQVIEPAASDLRRHPLGLVRVDSAIGAGGDYDITVRISANPKR